LDSRVNTTRLLREAVAASARPPRVWLNASTATIYRQSMDRPNGESNGEIGSGFSVDVATSWEREFFAGSLPGTRRAALRMAIVLGDGPATRMFLGLARLGLGGTQHDGWCPPHRRYGGIGAHPTGSDRAPWYRTHGRQRFSWVHIDDVVAAIRFIRDHDDLSGPINIASPHPTDNRTLMRTLRKVVGMPIGIPTMRWMLELGMWAMRTESELILKSRWVVPETLERAGFTFRHPDLEEALRDVS
jgi:NAD dependent epimerase/dehydratase family enzyme